MQDHLTTCESCARMDTRLRRALIVARSSPTVELSPDFRRRLELRLAAERLVRPGVAAAPRFRSRATLFATVTGVAIIGIGLGLTGLAAARPQPAATVVLAPIVVMPPTLPTEPVAAPAVFATVSSSLPVYTAMLLAQRATEQYAATHARNVSFHAAH